MKDLNDYQNAVRKLDLAIEKERYRVCSEAKTKYIPNGLLTSIPSNWNCTIDQSEFFETLFITLTSIHEKLIFFYFEDLHNMTQNAKIEYGSTVRWTADEAWSIVLIGITGAGKSYFANTLLGSQKPNRPDTNLLFNPDDPNASDMTCFYARKSVASVTSKGKSTLYFCEIMMKNIFTVAL